MVHVHLHPYRGADGFTIDPNLRILGSHSSDAWAMCPDCGAYFWFVTDDGKFQYQDSWALDKDLAEAALVKHDASALARMFVSMDLPKGPVWESPQALISIFCALTPGATDESRAHAIESAHPTGRWAEAARTLALHARARLKGTSLPFDFDVRVPGVCFGEYFEVGDALVVLSEKNELFRFERAGLVHLPLGAKPEYMAQGDGRLMLAVSPGLIVLDPAGNATSWPMTGTYSVIALDGDFWLFVPQTSDTERWIEFHQPDGRPHVKLRGRFRSDQTYMAPPRRFAGGWIVSNLIDDEGATQALTLFDSEFKTVAFSSSIDGERMLAPIDETSFFATTDNTMERWVRRDRALERVQSFPARSSWLIGDLLIVDQPDGEVIGRELDGDIRWKWKRATNGATYGVSTKSHVLVWDLDHAHLLGVDGKARKTFDVSDPDVSVGKAGTIYLKSGAELFIIVDGESTTLIVGTDAHMETTCGDDVLVRREDEACFLVGCEGIRGTFDASASFSVVGTRGGPYVIEGDRVRGRFGQAK